MLRARSPLGVFKFHGRPPFDRQPARLSDRGPPQPAPELCGSRRCQCFQGPGLSVVGGATPGRDTGKRSKVVAKTGPRAPGCRGSFKFEVTRTRRRLSAVSRPQPPSQAHVGRLDTSEKAHTAATQCQCVSEVTGRSETPSQIRIITRPKSKRSSKTMSAKQNDVRELASSLRTKVPT